jgi:N6-L-threonylcarbamoyladenine synthase
MVKDIIGLGLESSCDETSASVVVNGSRILSNRIFSQIEIHRSYYGVVPEIASRSHLETINLLIHEALDEAGIDFSRLDYVSVTNRPGLVGSLIITLQSAKAIAFTLDIPLIAVNHLEAHLYAPFLEGHELKFPYLGLLISGGNTAIYLVKGISDIEVLGKTSDDAVGEAFDKVAKFLDLGYPGGPAVEKSAKNAARHDIRLPKILHDSKDLRFSYSGIKTAVINTFRKNPETDVSEIAYSFQERALELLVRNIFRAAGDMNIKRIVVAGGVACNGRLRELLREGCRNGEEIIIPSPELCTDNAAMVAGIGYRYFIMGQSDSLETDVYARV